MRTSTTIKSFTLALALTTALAAPLLAAARDDARHGMPPRDNPNVITRVIRHLTDLIRALSDQVVVPQPVNTTTTN